MTVRSRFSLQIHQHILSASMIISTCRYSSIGLEMISCSTLHTKTRFRKIFSLGNSQKDIQLGKSSERYSAGAISSERFVPVTTESANVLYQLWLVLVRQKEVILHLWRSECCCTNIISDTCAPTAFERYFSETRNAEPQFFFCPQCYLSITMHMQEKWNCWKFRRS